MFGPFQPSSQLLARATRKLRLTTKQTNKGYYKGTGASNNGHFSYNPKRFYIFEIEYSKVRTFVRPEGMDNCQLTPFVAKRVQVPPGQKKRLTGKDFLTGVKEYGEEIVATS